MEKDISQQQIKVINAVSIGFKMVEGPDADDFGMRVFCLEAMDSATAEQIEDMAAYIDFASENGYSADHIGAQLLHDLSGLANNEPCFLPRTYGYAAKAAAVG